MARVRIVIEADEFKGGAIKRALGGYKPGDLVSESLLLRVIGLCRLPSTGRVSSTEAARFEDFSITVS